ncbi:UPF0489 family protein [Peribacillus sp. SIMBA_075]|uniref:UPF0489 family protein n=1 Tax=Peribacillus sp. SIMBA_075 TaxID=3085813 RepID=UPI0039781A0F
MGALKNYKVCFPEHKIFVMCDHNWAFAAWELSKVYDFIEPNATLVHVDAHLDDLPDGILANGLGSIKNKQDVYNVTEKLQIANFIWAGFATDSIDNIIYVTPKTNETQSHDPFDLSDWKFNECELELSELLSRKKYQGKRLQTIEDLVYEKVNGRISQYLNNKPVILDLDLDYFNTSQYFEPELMDDEKIRKNLISLRDLYDWDLITVALSPLFCGGDDACWHIYEIFLEVFNLDLTKTELW